MARGGGMGVMSSFNRLGVTWSGAHHGLMTGVLRDEWGMKGAAITDCSVMAAYMDYRLGVLAGQDLWDGYSMGMETLDGLDNDPAIVSAVQTAVKHMSWMNSATTGWCIKTPTTMRTRISVRGGNGISLPW